ncbi:YoaK family protein [Streptomyces silaceus]|uniref:YoaK family protein n=1 Tax=Streptomyces silaceus TaxID=545123 RepID=UPI0006EB8303|nr:YoaK family protein [Streptomyces silaceus]
MPTAEIGDRHPLSLVLVTLTAVSGLVDAVCHLGLGHVFTANMTGNVVVIGFALAGAPGFSVTGSLVSLLAFLVGAAGAGRLALAFRGRHRVPWVRTAVWGEALLLAVATAAAFATGGTPPYPVIVLVALAMGLRNGTVGRLAVPDMTTTVLTRTLAALAAESRLAGGTDRRAVRRIVAVTAMLAGAIPGAWLVLHHGIAWPLLLTTLIVAATALAYREHA